MVGGAHQGCTTPGPVVPSGRAERAAEQTGDHLARKTPPEGIGRLKEARQTHRQKRLPVERRRAGGNCHPSAVKEAVQGGQSREQSQKPDLIGKNHPTSPLRGPIRAIHKPANHATQDRSRLTDTKRRAANRLALTKVDQEGSSDSTRRLKPRSGRSNS